MIMLDDLNEEVTEEKRRVVLHWFNELSKAQREVFQGKSYEQPLLDLLKEAKNGDD